MYPSLELKYETRYDDVLLIAMSNHVGEINARDTEMHVLMAFKALVLVSEPWPHPEATFSGHVCLLIYSSLALTV